MGRADFNLGMLGPQYGCVAQLPIPTHNLVASNEWEGGPVVFIENENGNPTAKDVSNNFPWLKAAVKYSPTKVRYILNMLVLCSQLVEKPC